MTNSDRGEELSNKTLSVELQLKQLELNERNRRLEIVEQIDELELRLKSLSIADAERKVSDDQILFDRATGYIRVIALVAIPIAVATLGNSATNAWKDQEVSLGYVEIAIGVLSQPPSPETQNIREWAIATLQQHATVDFTEAASEELRITPLPLAETVEVLSRNPRPTEPVAVSRGGEDLIVTVAGEDSNEYSFYLEFLQNQIPPDGDFRIFGWNGEQLVISPGQIENEIGNFVQGTVEIDRAAGVDTYEFSIRFSQGGQELRIITFRGSFATTNRPFPIVELALVP